MNSTLRLARLALPIMFLVVGAGLVKAQLLTPFLSQGGVQSALATAQGSLGGDAALVGVGTFGDFEYQGQSVQFSTADGKANLWAYVFRSATAGQAKTIAVVSLPIVGYTAFELPDSGLDVPSDAAAISESDAYFGSDAMVGRLATDTAYVRFRAKYADLRPLFVTLRVYTAADSLDLPGGFPIEQPLWTVLWLGEGDSSLVCAVASKTGETFCQRVELPSSSVPDYAGVVGTASITVTPNPAVGRVLVTLDLPEGASTKGMSVVLYNATGQQVADLTGEFSRGDGRTIDLQTSQLSAGAYYFRATGSNWVGTTGLILEK